MNEPEAEFFQIYLEETDEQIDALCEVLESWRRDPSSGTCLSESLRLLSSPEDIQSASCMPRIDTSSFGPFLTHHCSTACSSDATPWSTG
jgi:hypothetical protein